MAPMITGIELVFSPTDATIMAKARIYAFGPLKSMLPRIYCEALSVSMWSLRLTISLMYVLTLLKKVLKLFSIQPILLIKM